MTHAVLIDTLKECLRLLQAEDGCLFGLPSGAESDTLERKLHEVCINHRLANHLERLILPQFAGGLFVDIEFNREGGNEKEVQVGNAARTIRPDIIIHNRQSGEAKRNVLAVECKKAGASQEQLKNDRERLEGLITDSKYGYSYGLQVTYGTHRTTACLLYMSDGQAPIEAIEISS
jgi:hypothetical protein